MHYTLPRKTAATLARKSRDTSVTGNDKNANCRLHVIHLPTLRLQVLLFFVDHCWEYGKLMESCASLILKLVRGKIILQYQGGH